MKQALIIAALLLPVGSALAQGNPLLTKYRDMALDYNHDLKVAQQNVEYTAAKEQMAHADLLPKVSASAMSRYTGKPMELNVTLPQIGNLAFEGDNMSYAANLQVLQPVYTGGRNRLMVDIAQQERHIAEENITVTKQSVYYQADCKYWNAVAAKEYLSISKQMEQAMENIVEAIQQRVDVKLVNPSDLLMAEVKLNEARFARKQAEESYTVSLMALNAFIGTNLNAQTPIDDTIPSLKPDVIAPFSGNKEWNNRAELRIAQQQVNIQQTVQRIADSYYKPQFYLGVEGSYSSPGYNFNSDFDPNYAIYAKLSVPIFEWGKRKNTQRASGLKVNIAQESLSKVTDNVKLEVESVYSNCKQSIEQVELTRNSLTKALQNEQMALDRYAEGNISVLELLDARIFYQKAQVNYIRSRMNAQVYYSQLKKALGIELD
ncbi:Outer membrane efflux protein [anaerobic digester metagenome]